VKVIIMKYPYSSWEANYGQTLEKENINTEELKGKSIPVTGRGDP
jgi:hypothetical protein